MTHRNLFFSFKLYITIVSALVLSMIAPTLWAQTVAKDSTDATAIMKAVEARDKGDKIVSRMKLVVEDSRGRQRVRAVQNRALEFAGGTKQLMIFEHPADVRNTGLLSIDYDDGAKDDDQWLFLPSLHKSTRISSSGKSGSFMGTDLTYSDMTARDPANYDYKILEQSTQAGGDDCWLIEARPKTAKEKEETGYVKMQLWVSKEKIIMVQGKMWVREGKKIKYLKFGDFEKIDGIWMVKKITAKTVRNKKVESTTVITMEEVKLNQPGVTEKDFTQARLEQGI